MYIPEVINPTPSYLIGMKSGGLVLVPVSGGLNGGGDTGPLGVYVGPVTPGQPNAGAAGGGAFTGGTLVSALNEAPTVTVASASTSPIFAAAGNSINLTGTTTVNAFDTIAAGAYRRVVFGGALQLTNSGSLINITGANITTAAGDVAEFLSQGGSVTKMLTYTRFSGAALVGGGSFTGGTLTSALNDAPPVTIASSATPAIFAAAGNSITLTGTTTVTGFDTIAAGAIRHVVFSGALQLTNGANLINLTGANITTAAGDTADFVSQGAGVTRMINYARASGSALVGSGGGLNMTPDVVSATTYTLVAGDSGKNKVFTNGAGCVITANTGLGASFFCFISKSAAAGTLTFAGTATITADSGSVTVSAPSAVCLFVPTATDVYDLQGPTGPAAGAAIDQNAVDITATRALTSADFGVGIVRINSASVVAVTVPTVASMALPATAGKVRTLIFQVEGAGVPTWAGATASTSLNGTAGTGTSLPGSNAGAGGTAPTRYQYVCLTQVAPGSDTWTLQ